MIWIILTIAFYLTSGMFFISFQLHFNKEAWLHSKWKSFDTVAWTILWLPIALIILILATYTEIREGSHG